MAPFRKAVGSPIDPPSPHRAVLTVDVQRYAGLQRVALGHGTIPNDAYVLGTVVRPSGQYLQRRICVVVLGAALQRVRLQWHFAALSKPAATYKEVRQSERATAI